jgi:hypothetical protein
MRTIADYTVRTVENAAKLFDSPVARWWSASSYAVGPELPSLKI